MLRFVVPIQSTNVKNCGTNGETSTAFSGRSFQVKSPDKSGSQN